MTLALDALPDDPDLLKAMIIEQRAESARMAASVRAYEALVQALKLRIARLRRQRFGASSEKIEREIEQLKLALEDLDVKIAADDPRPEPEADVAGSAGRGFPTMRPASGSSSIPARPARTAAARCACSARTSPRCWSSSPQS